MELEWNSEKAAANFRKHRVSFEEASSVFGDPFHDPDHSVGEVRWLTFGLSRSRVLLVVSHTQRGKRVRLEPTKTQLLSPPRPPTHPSYTPATSTSPLSGNTIPLYKKPDPHRQSLSRLSSTDIYPSCALPPEPVSRISPAHDG
ncbi:MAG: BrnT family toxin [Chromatiales bacterium]